MTADWLCVLLEDYQNDPDKCTWYEPPMAYDDESAAKIFMEEFEDPDGYFGLDDTADHERHVLVWNNMESRALVVRVTPNPSPGYFKDIQDADDVYEEHNLKIEEVGKPTNEQVSY